MEIEEGLLCKADVQWNTTYTSKKYRITSNITSIIQPPPPTHKQIKQ